MPAIPAIIMAGASIGSAALASRSQNRSTRALSDAQRRADEIQLDANRRAEQIQREQMDYDRWLQAATSAARQPYLDQAAGIGIDTGPTPYAPADPFVAPTQQEATNDPAYQFSLAEGQKALEQSAAARGTLLTGGTGKDLQAYGQQMATNQYDKVYGRALNAYQMREALRQQAYGNELDASRLRQSASLGRIHALMQAAGYALPGTYPGYQGGQAGLPVQPGRAVRRPLTLASDPTQQPRRSWLPRLLEDQQDDNPYGVGT